MRWSLGGGALEIGRANGASLGKHVASCEEVCSCIGAGSLVDKGSCSDVWGKGLLVAGEKDAADWEVYYWFQSGTLVVEEHAPGSWGRTHV